MLTSDAELIGLIYEAATEPTRWLELRKRLSHALDGSFWIFFTGVSAVADGKPTFLADDDQLREHLMYRDDDDDPYRVFLRTREAGWVDMAQNAIGAEDMALSETGRHVARETDHGGSVHSVLFNEGQRLIMAGLTVRNRSCDARDLERMRALVPHLVRAVRLTDHLREIEHQHHNMREAVDLVHVSVLLLSTELRIRWCNAPARRLLERGDTLQQAGDVLTATDPSNQRRIAELVSRARSGKPEVTRVSSADADAWCSLLAIRLSALDAAAAADVALFVSQSSQVEIDAGILCALHGLTPAEAEVTRLLATGQSTEEIAARRRVRQGTVRAQLKQIFAKTGCRTQAELVRLVLIGPALMRRAE